MLMSMLHRGGLQAWVDSDDGRFEAWLPSVLTPELAEVLRGPGCVKIFDSLLLTLGFLPEKMIQTDRPIAEITASWGRAFPAKSPLDPDRLLIDRRKVAATPGALLVSFHDLVDSPYEQASRIAEFLGGELDVVAMAAIPDPALRHFGGASRG